MLVEDAIKATGLILIPFDSIFDLFGSVAEKVVCLALAVHRRSAENTDDYGFRTLDTDLHRPNTSVQEKEPVVDLVRLSGAFRIADKMVRIVLLDEVLHDGARLK